MSEEIRTQVCLTPLRVLADLTPLVEPAYRRFVLRGLPTVSPEKLLGVRVALLRWLAAGYAKQFDTGEYLSNLPHAVLEENYIHGFLIARISHPEHCLAALEAFLPHVYDWATCDSLSPVAVRAHAEFFLPHFLRFLDSPHEFQVRFALVMLLKHYLKSRLSGEVLERVAGLQREEYYVCMAQSWFWAEATIRHLDIGLSYLRESVLAERVRRGAVQKLRDSRRVSKGLRAQLEELSRGDSGEQGS